MSGNEESDFEPGNLLASSNAVVGRCDRPASVPASRGRFPSLARSRIAKYAEEYIAPQSKKAAELVVQEAGELADRVAMLLEILEGAHARVRLAGQREVSIANTITEQ